MPDFHQNILGSLSSGIIAVDAEGKVIAANLAASAHLGMADECLQPGTRLADLPGAEPLLTATEEVAQSHASLSRREAEITLPSGQKREIGFSVSPLEGPEAYNGVVFLFVDMTERRNHERAAELNRQLAALGELTAGVVHELRNPVTVIGGLAELLLRRMESDDPARKTADTIFAEAAQLEKSISQFLGFARPYELELASCRPEDIVERAVQLCQRRADRKGVEIHARCAPGVPPLRADGARVAQALANILNNAIDAVTRGGQVDLEARVERAEIVFEVTDNGSGIVLAPGESPFTPFFSKKESGTGLGLTIVHRIVAAHHGDIAYANRQEGGACFTIRLPVET